MRTSRTPLALLVVALAGCGGTPVLTTYGDGAPEVLRVVEPGGVTILDPEAPEVVGRVLGGVPTTSWVFRVEPTAAGSRLEAIDHAGYPVWERSFTERLAVRVAAADGSLVALLPDELAVVDPYTPAGRATTPLVIASTQGEDDRAFELEGNFEPEAFTSDGTGLFMIEYLPAEQPDRYRVRKLDLNTSAVDGVPSIDQHLQEEMRGTARVSDLSDDGNRLYTLYTTEGHDGPHAFVHVLDLAEGWAHCVFLPQALQAAPEERLAIAAGGADEPVAVVDAAGVLVRIDPTSLQVTGTWSFPPLFDAAPPVAAVDGDELYVARGAAAIRLDTAGRVTDRWTTDAPARGIALDRSGRVWLATDDELVAFVPGRDGADQHLPIEDGTFPHPTHEHDQPIECAC